MPRRATNRRCIVAIVALVTGASCLPQAEGGGPVDPAPFAVTSLDPDTGPVGTEVTIRGRGFRPRVGEDHVRFGAVEATVEGAAEDGTWLRTRVPEGAATSPVTVTLDVDGVQIELAGPLFMVTPPGPPRIDAVDPPVAWQGMWSDHVVTGSGFRADTELRIDGLPLLVSYESATRIGFSLAADAGLAAGSHELVLVTPGLPASDAHPFEVRVPLDLLAAQSSSATSIRLRFANGEAPSLRPANVHLEPALEVTAIARDPEHPGNLELTTSPQDLCEYSLRIDADPRNAERTPVRGAEARFLGWGSFPGVVGFVSQSLDPGCTADLLYEPWSLSIVDGSLVVTERAGNQLQWTGPDGTPGRFLGFDGSSFGFHDQAAVAAGCPALEDGPHPQGLWRPRGAVVTDGERLFVSDTGQGRILAVSGDGSSFVVIADGIDEPVLMGLEGDRLLICSKFGDLERVDPATGAREPYFWPATSQEMLSFHVHLGFAPGLARAGASTFVAATGDGRIVRFIDGVFAGWIGAGHVNGFESGGACCDGGWGDGEFVWPTGLAVDLAGTLWVADQGNGVGGFGGRLQRFTLDGAFLGSFAVGSNQTLGGLAVDDANVLWLAYPEDDQVVGYRL